MNCREMEKLLILYIDNEIAPEEKDMVESHVRSCLHCRELLDQHMKIKKASSEISFSDPPSSVMENYWSRVSSRLSKGGGWIFLIIGSTILALYAIYRFIIDPGIHSLIKITIAAIIIGIILLFISVLIDRMREIKTDRYRGIQK